MADKVAVAMNRFAEPASKKAASTKDPVQLVEGATFGPEALKAMGQAFDQAWADVDDTFTTLLAKTAARLHLANAIFAVATDERHDVDTLRSHGLQALALKYPLSVRRQGFRDS